jgi:hypothetical protein
VRRDHQPMRTLRVLVVVLAVFMMGRAPAVATDSARVTFTKSFPGSTPAYVSIAVERSGTVSYKEVADDDPDQFQLEGNITAAIFDLARKLNHFSQPIESGLKVANTGAKTFRWEDGAESNEAKFNFSVDENAKTLLDIFERISESERLFIEFQRAIRHDKLGVHQALVNIQIAWDRKRLLGTPQFLPLFDQVAKSDIYLHMARERAAQLAESIRAMNPKAE